MGGGGGGDGSGGLETPCGNYFASLRGAKNKSILRERDHGCVQNMKLLLRGDERGVLHPVWVRATWAGTLPQGVQMARGVARNTRTAPRVMLSCASRVSLRMAEGEAARSTSPEAIVILDWALSVGRGIGETSLFAGWA